MTGVKTITATEFKTKCLQILDHVPPPPGLTTTKRGKPVASLLPQTEGIERFCGSTPEMCVDPEDNLLSTEIKWDAES